MDPWGIDPRAEELLENQCSFALAAMPSSMLPENEDLELIAGDCAGGCFYLWHAQRRGDQVPVVYLSSYGETSRFAEDFTATLVIVTSFPTYWGDMLVAAHKGDEVLARCLSHYEEGLEPECAEARDELCDLLDIDPSIASAKLIAAVRAVPAFAPMLNSGRGQSPARSFKNRIAPA